MQLLGRTPLPMGSVLICSQKEQYRILSLLGCGGSGLVYRACRVSKQGTEGAVFAVKECFPAPALAFDGSQIQFSRNSAGQILPSEEYGNTELKTHAQAYLQRVAAQLKSENQTLIDLTAQGNAHLLRPVGELSVSRIQSPEGIQSKTKNIYFAMENLEGQGFALSQVVERCGILSHGRNGTIRQVPVGKSASILSQVLIALSQIHQGGYLFGDLQEGNLFLKQDGVLEEPGFCCLLDFGSARKLRESTQTVLLNPEDFVFSTPGYTPPELLNWDRQTPLELGPAADLYAAGRLFSKLITGLDHVRRMPDGKMKDCADPYLTRLKPKEAVAIQCGDLLRSRVNAFLDKALAPEPDRRYQNAQEMLMAVQELSLQAERKEPVSSYSDLRTFVGRQRLLETLSAEMEQDSPAPIFLYGLGGIGKTEAMLKLAKQMEISRPGKFVPVFAPFRGSIRATISAIPFFNYDEMDYETGKFKSQEVLYREKLDFLQSYGDKLLLLIDNWYDENKSFCELRADRDFGAVLRLGHVLFTTRYGEEEEGSWYHVEELSEDDLYALMRKIYRPELSQDQDCEEEYWLRQLIRLVECHTYTVDLIARSLAAKGNPHTPEELFHAMSQANTLDIRQLPRIGTGKDRNIPETDAAKQQRLLNHLCSLWDITALEKAEKDVMACACLIPDSGMDLRLFKSALSEEEQDAADDLLERGWILCDSKPKLLRLHMTVKQVCKRNLTLQPEQYGNFLESLWQWWEENQKHIFQADDSNVSFLLLDSVLCCLENAIRIEGAQSHYLDYFEAICTETSIHTLEEIDIQLQRAQRLLDEGQDLSELEEDENLPVTVLTDSHGESFPCIILDYVEYEGEEYAILIPPSDQEHRILTIFSVEEDEDALYYADVTDPDILRGVFEQFQAEIFSDGEETMNISAFLESILGDSQDPLVPKLLKTRISERRKFLNLSKAAEEGNPEAMILLGKALEDGEGTLVDMQKAFDWYHRAALCGSSEAMMLVAQAYANGKPVPQNGAEAFHWYMEAARAGNPDAMLWLGKHYRNNPNPDPEKAFYWYQRAAEAGNISAMLCVGNCCCDSIGCTQDYEKALFWFEKAHKLGNPVGTNNLGWMYLNGCGCQPDYHKARLLFEQAIQADSPPKASFRHLSRIYRDGLGVTPDHVKALWYFSKGEKNGNGNSDINRWKKKL